MARFHQAFLKQLPISKVLFLMVGISLSIQLLTAVTMVSAQGIDPTPPPSPRLDSDIRYFGSTGGAGDTTSSQDAEPSVPTEDSSAATPYVAEEGIPVMAETVVEGSTIESFDDPFDNKSQRVVPDPWEPFNAEMFEFNYQMDRHVLKPAAKGYNFVVPPDVQGSIANAFHNMGFMTRFLNSLFQGKYGRAGIETKRFLINSTVGVAGLFDVAKYVFETEAPPGEDFGQSLAVMGLESGPFLVLPFLPPMTVRDAVGYAGDIAMNPVNYVIPFVPNLGLNAEQTINDRSRNLDRFEGIEESTVDLYGAVLSGYSQRRAKDIEE